LWDRGAWFTGGAGDTIGRHGWPGIPVFLTGSARLGASRGLAEKRRLVFPHGHRGTCVGCGTRGRARPNRPWPGPGRAPGRRPFGGTGRCRGSYTLGSWGETAAGTWGIVGVGLGGSPSRGEGMDDPGAGSLGIAEGPPGFEAGEWRSGCEKTGKRGSMRLGGGVDPCRVKTDGEGGRAGGLWPLKWLVFSTDHSARPAFTRLLLGLRGAEHLLEPDHVGG